MSPFKIVSIVLAMVFALMAVVFGPWLATGDAAVLAISGPTAGVLALVGGALAFKKAAAIGRSVVFEVEPEGLRVAGSKWVERFFPAEGIRGGEAYAIPPGSPEHQIDRLAPRAKIIQLPGFACGWFTLKKGRKVFLCAVRGRQAIYVPMDGGHDLVVTPAEPDAMLQALRERFPAQ